MKTDASMHVNFCKHYTPIDIYTIIMDFTHTSFLSSARSLVLRATLGVALMLACLPASAQNGADKFRIGAYGYGSLVNHAADFRSLPRVGCCGPGFTGGSGAGFGAGFL